MVPELPRFNPVDRRSALPLWAQVNADIERRLRAGEFADSFPGEMALVEQYGVSRHTIREALRQLRSSGLVDAGRGRPPRVVSTEITQPQGSLYSLFTSVRAAGHSQRSIVRALEARADGTVAVRLGLEESTPLIYLERVRLVDEEPLAIDRVWLPARIAAPLLDVDFTQTSLYAELRDRCGVRLTGGHEQIRAVVPTTAEQMLLAIPARTAALAIDRTGELGGRPVEWRQTIVRGDRFSLLTDLTRPHWMEARVVDASGATGASPSTSTRRSVR
ncbi:GntR family transcriptional regulator [Nocardioides sp.]|uniref:GntR family transcriptional regulator n=1 Tax=Nocardioides sp. TaxID=35761 RepID=UPI002EDB0424